MHQTKRDSWCMSHWWRSSELWIWELRELRCGAFGPGIQNLWWAIYNLWNKRRVSVLLPTHANPSAFNGALGSCGVCVVFLSHKIPPKLWKEWDEHEDRQVHEALISSYFSWHRNLTNVKGESCEEMKSKESTGVLGLRVCLAFWQRGWSPSPPLAGDFSVIKSEAESMKILVELSISVPVSLYKWMQKS